MKGKLTSAPNNPVRLDLIQDPLRIRVGLDIVQGLDQDIDLSGSVLPRLENGIRLVGVADHRSDVPGPRDEFRGHEEADLAVAAEEEDACGWGHG